MEDLQNRAKFVLLPYLYFHQPQGQTQCTVLPYKEEDIR